MGGVNVNGREIGLYCVTGLHLLVVQLAAGGRAGEGPVIERGQSIGCTTTAARDSVRGTGNLWTTARVNLL